MFAVFALLSCFLSAAMGWDLASWHQRPLAMSTFDHLRLVTQSMSLFENKTLVMSVVVREPFVIYKRPKSTPTINEIEAQSDIENYSGIAVEVVKRLKTIFGFKLKIIRPKDNQFGVLLADGSWSGMVGSLVANESDLGVTALSITSARAKAIDFTRAYYVETATILLPIPEEVKNYSAIFEPFSEQVWLVTFGFIVGLIITVTVMTKSEVRWTKAKREQTRKLINLIMSNPDNNQALIENCRMLNHFNDLRERFYYAVTCVLNILLIRDIKHPPERSPLRILICFWWLSTIVIVNIYFGILFGQLVIPRRPNSIDSLEELVSQSKVKYAVTRGSAIYELFRDSPGESIYGQLGRRMQDVTSADEGVSRVVNSGLAFIREKSILTFKMAQEHNRLRACKMQLAKKEFFSVGFGLGLRKNSAYLGPFNSALTLMIENGFVPFWIEQNQPTKTRFTDCKLEPREGEPLSIKHFISIYLVCSCLILVAACILLYQHVHGHFVASLCYLAGLVCRRRRRVSSVWGPAANGRQANCQTSNLA